MSCHVIAAASDLHSKPNNDRLRITVSSWWQNQSPSIPAVCHCWRRWLVRRQSSAMVTAILTLGALRHLDYACCRNFSTGGMSWNEPSAHSTYLYSIKPGLDAIQGCLPCHTFPPARDDDHYDHARSRLLPGGWHELMTGVHDTIVEDTCGGGAGVRDG